MDDDDAAAEPLLRPRDRPERCPGNSAAETAAVDRLFVQRIWRLVRAAECGDAILLVLLSVTEVGILSQAGLVRSSFYNALLSKNSTLFLAVVGRYLMWYSAETLCTATKNWAAEWLAIRWRQKLTNYAHEVYCSGPSLCQVTCVPIDNPDERVTHEIDCLCQNLAQLILKTVTPPVMTLYYTWWVAYHVGWYGPLIIYAYFIAGASWTRWIISPIAGLVARQEKLEAMFRIAHVRFHANAEAIAMSDGGNIERATLDGKLQEVLLNMKKLVSKHFLLAVNINAYNYLGGVLNYCVLAIPVFGGFFDSDDSGQLANLISNASFAVSQLIYSFSQVLDTAKLVSDLAGHVSRVAEFFEVLDILSSRCEDAHDHISPHGDTAALASTEQKSTDPDAYQDVYTLGLPTRLKLDTQEIVQFSMHFTPAALHCWLRRVFPGITPASLLVVPVFEITAEKEGSDVQDDACSVVVQPGCNEWVPSSGHYTRTPHTDVESDLEEKVGELMLCIVERLREFGHWAHVLEPCSRSVPLCCPHHSGGNDQQQPVGPNEVITAAGASVRSNPSVATDKSWVRYPQEVNSILKELVGHSSGGSGSAFVCNSLESCLLSSIFTTAPVRVLHTVLSLCCAQEAAEMWRGYPGTSGEGVPPTTVQTSDFDVQAICKLLPAIVVDHMTCFIPGTHFPVVKDLTLQLQWGESLLITGATGSGKTSFLKALCGLWQLSSGRRIIPPRLSGKGVLVLPQTPLLAKEMDLAGQILYPVSQVDMNPLDTSRLNSALEGLGMLHLLERMNNTWQGDWTDSLSPGERQSLALARVLYHRPQLVILDEATNAFSEAAEDAIYQQIMGLGITVVSVAHRSRLFQYHTRKLSLFGDGHGGWALS